jgi:exonuclease III
MNELNRKFKFLSWNVRVVNDKNKRSTLKNLIQSESPDVLCL